jgi:glycosyltransferase involved in cell wall biosynthesis
LAVIGITHPQACLVLRGRLAALREAGFRVVLISSPGEWATRLAAEEGASHVAIPMNRGLSPLSDLLALARLCRTLHRLQPSLTEFSTPKAGLLGSVAAWLCRVPTRIYMLRGLRLETASGLTCRVLKATEWVAAACSHTVVCNSRSLRTAAESLGIAPQSKLRLVAHGSSNGVDTDRFMPGPDRLRQWLGIPAAAPVIGYVGRLTRDKGIPELLDAFDQLLASRPDTRLLLVGWFDKSEDRLGEHHRQRIRSHPRIIHTGFVPDPAEYYRAMNMLVLPTWREGFPNVALEAAASGIPVIATETTGARDAVVRGLTGLLVPPGSPEALARAMQLLLDEPALRAGMGQAARSWVEIHFARQHVLNKTVALYAGMLQSARTAPLRALATDAAAVIE